MWHYPCCADKMWMYIILAYFMYRLYDWYKHYPWVDDISTKCVFITGCDSGFGNKTAKSLYSRGVPVFAGCLTENGARRLRQETGHGLYTVVVDITSTESIQEAYRYVLDNLPPGTELWGVVNNAGVTGNGGPVEFLHKSEYRQVMEVNCFGPIEVVRIFLPSLKKSRGRIVNTTSMVSEIATPGTYPYTVSKFAVRSYSEALRYEKSLWGIDVATVEPGLFKTNIVNLDDFKRRFTELWEGVDPDIRAEYGQQYFDSVLSSVSQGIEAQAAPNLSPVVHAYEHALFAKLPYAKYLPGMDSKVFVFFKNYCPSFILDKIIMAFFTNAIPEVLKTDKKNQ